MTVSSEYTAMTLFDHELTEAPPELNETLNEHFGGYGNDLTEIVAPDIVWEEMARQILDKDIQMNGCGAKDHFSEYVPETMWGLCVTPLCNIHDICYTLANNKKDCDESNRLFLRNLTIYVNKNSNWFMRRIRRRRVMTYYSFVHEGRKTHCRGYYNGSTKKT